MTRRRINPNQLALFEVAASMPTGLSRATARRGRHEAPAPKPWQCTLLAVDTARQSGWAIYCMGVLQEHGEVDTLDEATLEQLVRNALEIATDCAVPLVLVLEEPFGGRPEIVAALGVARERWLRAWRQADQSLRRVVRVQPSTWRGPVLGSEWVSAPRNAVRDQEMRTARALTKRMTRYDGSVPPLGHDEAAAILIGRWAAHAAAVGRAIGKRATKASLRSWMTAGAPVERGQLVGVGKDGRVRPVRPGRPRRKRR